MSIVRVASQPPAQAETPGHGYVQGEVVADKYRLLKLVAEGGMGSVWIAQNLALDAQVALKLIRSDIGTEGADDRLLTEARATARLKHPGIIRVFDFGRTHFGDPFIVMELLTGESLGDVLDREGRLPATQAVQLMLPIADGLAAAHAKQVVHRDLKPDNVFLADSDGRLQPKLLDFGIAKVTREERRRNRRLTDAGTVLGSPDYMSPEQARGAEDVDHRADIWAYCIVLYEAVTGRVPFQDANYNALLRHIIESDIPSILDHAAGDAALWEILKKGLEKDRDVRYQSIRHLAEDLAAWLVSHGVSEDVSGHSLRAGWLDPAASHPNLGRISRTSFEHFDTTSSPRRLSHPVPPPTATTAATAVPVATWRSRPVMTAAFLLFLGLAATIGWMSTRPAAAPAADAPGPSEGSHGAAATVAVPATERDPPTASAPIGSATAAPAQVASPAQAAPARPQPARVDNPGRQAPVAPASSASAASPEPSTKPAPKAKSPYAEDLGF